MARSKELEMKVTKKPILPIGTGQTMCLEVKIGSLGLEVWYFPNEEAHPYARLIFEPDQGLKVSLNDNAAEEKANVSAKLDWQQGLLTHSERQHSRTVTLLPG